VTPIVATNAIRKVVLAAIRRWQSLLQHGRANFNGHLAICHHAHQTKSVRRRLDFH
jgi:hypothetical protein